MARNGSSVYTLPAGNPVVPGTTIATTWANTTLTDIATALTQSLSTDGSTAAVSLAGKTITGGTHSGLTTTGVIDNQGGQIKFPAVAVPSADVNTLDDYERGTWTPTLAFATPGTSVIAYSTNTGSYVKVGNLVTATFNIQTTTFTLGTAAGALNLNGLPFSCNNTTGFGGVFLGLTPDTVGGAGTNQTGGSILSGGALANFIYFNNTSGTSGGNIGIGTGVSTAQKTMRATIVYN